MDRGFTMDGKRFFLLLALLIPACLPAQESERAVAEWVLRIGGTVTLEARAQPLRDISELPTEDFHIAALDFTGTLIEPPELQRLARLSRLRELYLPASMWNPNAGSRLDANDALVHLQPLKNLEKLHLSLHFLTNINLQDKGLAHLSGLSNLKELRLAQTRIKGSSLAAFPNLRALDLSYTSFDDSGMESLKGMTQLSQLVLRDTLVTDKGLQHLRGLRNLAELDLYGMRVADAGLAALKELTALRKLNLLGAEITDAGLDALAGMTQLRELNLYRTRVTNAGLEKLKHLKELAALDLRYTRVSRAGVDSFSAQLPQCRVNFLDPSAQRAAGSGAPGRPAGKGERAIAQWVRSLGGKVAFSHGRLSEISLASRAISDAQLESLRGLAPLQKLNLERTEIGDIGAQFLEKLTGLTELNLSHTLISDSGLAHLSGLV